MRSRVRQFSVWTAMLVTLLCAQAGFAQDASNRVTARVTPIPTVSGPIPVTADSRPFLEAAKLQTPVDLAARGYVEEEFFVSGTGNVYDWAPDGTVTIKAADRPYTTRILLRRPSDPTRFSGTVLTEMFHSGLGSDNNLIWGSAGDYVMSHGDAYVGITVSGNTIGVLKVFNSTRYASLAFPAPVPGICGEQAAGGRGGRGGARGGGGGRGGGAPNPLRPAEFFPPADDSVHWDIISQVGALLKSNVPNKPLAGFNVRYIFASDHTASDTHTYARAFAKLATTPNGKPVYDGFLVKEGAGVGAVNACGNQMAPDDPRRGFKNIGVPVIFLLSQNYVARFVPIRREDSDAPGDQYRLYEVPGASHLDKWSFNNLAPMKDREAVGAAATGGIWPFNYTCEPMEKALPDYFPYEYFIHAMLFNLDEWVRNGVAPPRGDRMMIKNAGTPMAAVATDVHGNAIGGIRNPYVDVPEATFVEQMTGPGACNQIGYWLPFSYKKMETLYGGAAKYETKVLAGIDKLVQQRWLLKSDADKLKTELRTKWAAK